MTKTKGNGVNYDESQPQPISVP